MNLRISNLIAVLAMAILAIFTGCATDVKPTDAKFEKMSEKEALKLISTLHANYIFLNPSRYEVVPIEGLSETGFSWQQNPYSEHAAEIRSFNLQSNVNLEKVYVHLFFEDVTQIKIMHMLGRRLFLMKENQPNTQPAAVIDCIGCKEPDAKILSAFLTMCPNVKGPK